MKYVIALIIIVLAVSAFAFTKYKDSSSDVQDNTTNEIIAEKVETITATSTLDSRFKAATDIVHEMKPNKMSDIRELFPDLEETIVVEPSDPRNLMGKMSEPWLYSKKDDVTVIVCPSVNSPGHIFEGQDISQSEIDKIKTSIAEMMGDMNEDMMSDMKMDSKKINKSSSEKYLEYSADSFANTNQKKILFFYADWCPVCRNWEKRTTKALDSLPENTLIFKADFDTETELKKEYSITMQSIAIFFDANGNEVNRLADPGVETIREFFST